MTLGFQLILFDLIGKVKDQKGIKGTLGSFQLILFDLIGKEKIVLRLVNF